MLEIYTKLDKIDNVTITKIQDYDKRYYYDSIKVFFNDIVQNDNPLTIFAPNCDIFLVLTENKLCGIIATYKTDDGLFTVISGHPCISHDCWKKGLDTLKEFAKVNGIKKIYGDVYNKILVHRLKELGFKKEFIRMYIDA